MSPPRPLVNCSRPSLYLPPIPNLGTSCEKRPQDDRNREQTVSRTNPRIGLALSVFFFIANRVAAKSRRREEKSSSLFLLGNFSPFLLLSLGFKGFYDLLYLEIRLFFYCHVLYFLCKLFY